jgi:hypothetical protein
MKTEDLISALAADTHFSRVSIDRTVFAWCLTGTALSIMLFVITMGVRPDAVVALATWRFDLKLAIIVVAIVASLADCLRLARPDGGHSFLGLSWVVLIALGLAVVLELLAAPRGEWHARLIGTNAVLCLLAVPALALFPFLTSMLAMRRAAPMSPTAAGAGVGRLSASIAAAIYATHCFDDSPLFVATWYTLAVVAMSLFGALLGRRMLQW